MLVRVLIICIISSSCATNYSIHNQSIVSSNKAMHIQDKRMKKAMQRERKRCMPKQNKLKHKKAGRYYI